MGYVLVFLLLEILILLHELGHFFVARRVGMSIARFSVGFGPRVWGFRRGNTEFWLSAVPIGGYVLPALQDEESSICG